MTLTDEWSLFVAVLQQVAPRTARTIRPPASMSAVKRAETATGPWPPELHEFFRLHDGQSDVGGSGSVFPPGGSLLQVADVPDCHARMVESMAEIVADFPDMYDGSYADIVAEYDQAGIEADDHLFLPGYIPILQWDSNFMFCDARSGDRRGCVSYRDSAGGNMGIVGWASLEELVRDVRSAVTDRLQIGWDIPTIENGALQWVSA